MTQHKQSHRIKWHDHHIKWHDMHQNRSHHHHGTAEGSFTAKKWFGHRAGRSPCAHSIGKFFLCYIVLFSSETSAPGLPGNYLYINTIIRSYKILSPLEYWRANIHGLNWQLLCLGPWYCGISAAAFRRSESKEKPLSDFLRQRFMAGFRDVSWAAARAALEDAERFKECQDVPSVDTSDERE